MCRTPIGGLSSGRAHRVSDKWQLNLCKSQRKASLKVQSRVWVEKINKKITENSNNNRQLYGHCQQQLYVHWPLSFGIEEEEEEEEEESRCGRLISQL